MTANPNGFQDLIRAGTQLDPNTIPDVSTASTETLRTFVGKHSAVLEQARAALSKPCQVPLDYRVNGLRMDYVTQLRSLAYLFQAQAVLAHRESRPEEAARAGFDCVRLAHKGSRGGLQVDFLVAVAIEGMIASQISECRKELDADICRKLISELERIDRDREPVVDFSQRDRDWTRIVVGWRHDFWQAVYKLAGFHDELDLYESFQHRNEATMRLLIADLALQAYRLEQGQYPERLDSLVPDLMRSVPVDPFDGQPLRYRLEEGNEYVLYCVGLDGVDHGGQRVSEQKIMRGEGDYFLDAMAEESEE
jgi:hypothetical protein